MELIHVDKYNYIRSVNKFLLKENKTEYVINTRLRLDNGGIGEFYLLCLDQSFEDKEPMKLNNTTIFKIPI